MATAGQVSKKALLHVSGAVLKGLATAATEGPKSYKRTAKTVESSAAQGGEDPEFSTSEYVKLLKGPERAKQRIFTTKTLLNYDSQICTGSPGRLYIGEIITPLAADMKGWAAKLQAQNPTSFRPATGTTPITAIEESGVDLYHLSTELMIDFTNFSNVGCHLEIYDCHPKRNTLNNSRISWTEGLRDSQGHDAGGLVLTYGTGLVGSKPTDSEEFKGLWEIDFKRKLFLGPGDTHRHRQLHAPNRVLPMHELYSSEDGSAQEVMHSHTRTVLFSAHGSPTRLNPATATQIVNAPAGNFENQAVTYGLVDLGVMTTMKFRYSMLEFNSQGDIDVTGSLWATTVGQLREGDGDQVVADAI